MDNFDYTLPEFTPEEPVIQPAPQVRKASPFADSPYEFQPPVAPVKKPKKKGRGKVFLCVVLALLLAAGSCFGTAVVLNNQWEGKLDQLTKRYEARLNALENSMASSAPVIIPGGTTVSSAEGLTPAQVYAMNVRSVVMVYNRITSTNGYGQSGTAISTGSGFFLSADGFVVTNHHVIEGNGKLSIVTFDGVEHAATLVGSDSTNDVALLKVEGENFPAVTLGSSEDLVVGDQVVAIGNPLGELTSTQTVGYVSAKGRDVTTSGFAINMIQTDAAINSGNSGGPLFNMNGEVVGITTAKYSGQSSSGASIEGIGFAIPIDDVKDMLDDYANYGYVQSAYLGITVSDMNASAAEYYNMPMGAYVQDVVPGNCAYAAGMQSKDIIVAVGEYEVTGVNSLSRALRKFKAGDATTVTVYRGGKEIVLDIVLDEKPVEATIPAEPAIIIEGDPDQESLPEGGSFEDYYNFFKDYFGNGGN